MLTISRYVMQTKKKYISERKMKNGKQFTLAGIHWAIMELGLSFGNLFIYINIYLYIYARISYMERSYIMAHTNVSTFQKCISDILLWFMVKMCFVQKIMIYYWFYYRQFGQSIALWKSGSQARESLEIYYLFMSIFIWRTVLWTMKLRCR